MDIPRSEPAGAGDESSVPSGPGQLEPMLVSMARLRTAGLLRVTGEPGGMIYLADGRIAAISTPGAPDPEAILLRSGRVPEGGWSSAYAAAASDGRMAAELVKRDLIGAGELEAVLRTGLADALFALVAGSVEECRLEEAAATPALLPLDPGAEAERLLAEAGRRLGVLAGLGPPVSPDRDRLTAVPGAWTPRVGPDGQAEILALANGRRTARDMAFVLGRGVFAVTLQLSRMCDAGLLVVGSTRSPARAAGLRAVSTETAPPGPADASGSGGAPPLPRRRRGGSGQAEPRPAEKASVLRMLRTGVRREPSGG
jgi:hypothetical protein